MFSGDPFELDIDGRDANGNFPDDDWYEARRRYEDSRHTPTLEYYSPPIYQFKFETEEELMSSDIFQQCLSKALQWKDKEIESLRNELLNTM